MEMKDLVQVGLENATKMLYDALDGLTASELKWQPRPDANSIGLLFFHFVRVEDSAIHDIQGKPHLWVKEKWYQKFNKTVDAGQGNLTAEQISAFVLPDMKEWLVYAEAVRKDTLAYLKGLKNKDFEKQVDLTPPSTPAVATGGNAALPPAHFTVVIGPLLMHMIAALSGRAGEISYIRGLQRGMDK